MESLPSLNLPIIVPTLRQAESNRMEIYDPIREKFVALTPEEWVRQNFTAYLIEVLGYPRGLMVNEAGIRLNTARRRIDTLVYSRVGMQPLVVIEYKAPHIPITQKVFDQIACYNMVVGARWLVVSNGVSHFCCRYDGSGDYTFVREIPRYELL